MQGSAASTPRPRPQRSCVTCARRKVSCDKVRPACGRCQRAQLECVYVGAQPGLRFIDETPAIISEHGSLPARVQRLDHLIRSWDPSDEPSRPNCEAEAESEPRPEPGYLYQAGDSQSRYVSPTFFALISDEVAEINDLLQSQQRYTIDPLAGGFSTLAPNDPSAPDSPSMSTTVGSATSYRRRHGPYRHLYGDIFPHVPSWTPRDHSSSTFVRPMPVDDILSTMPTREQSRILLWGYMSGYHTVTPVFHGPSFLAKLRDFNRWLQGENDTYVYSPHFFALCSAVLFAGSVVCPKRQLLEVFGDVSREDLSTQLYKRAIEAIRLTSFPQAPSLESLAAFLIVDSTWLRDEQPLTCAAFVGLAIRVAHMLGLHRDPSRFPNLTPVEMEVRRRVWWQIRFVDVQVAVASGLPPLIAAGSFDVKTVHEGPEAALSRPLSGPASESQTILGIFLAGRIDYLLLGSKTLHMVHSASFGKTELRQVLDMIQELFTELEFRRRRILVIQETLASTYPSADNQDDLVKLSESNPRLARFTQTLLAMLKFKPYTVLYGQARRHGLFDYLMEQEPELMLHCKKFLHYFLRLAQCQDFQPWHWCWPGIHQPMHAMMAIIQDLEDHPNQATATETRKLIDLAFHMSSSQGTSGILSNDDGSPILRPLTEGGSEAWTFIRRARQRAWQKAGIDPNYLRCPELAVDIHIDDDAEMTRSSSEERNVPATEFFNDAIWGGVPETTEDWMMYGNATDPYFGFDPNPQFRF